jgi:hypothetical protein
MLYLIRFQMSPKKLFFLGEYKFILKGLGMRGAEAS